jgi:hypothetical protein
MPGDTVPGNSNYDLPLGNVHETGVSPGGQSGSAIVAAEAQQVERTRRKTCSRAESEFLCGDDVAGGFCPAGLTRFCADLVSS